MWRAAGSRIIEMPAADHDRLLAMTSHLPHALAYALVAQLGEQVGSDVSLQLAAGGFYDISRIASSDPVMWRDIFLSNREQVVARLQEYRESLGSLADLIAAGDSDALTEWLERARDLRERIGALRTDNEAP
jgi:prephenate dehydrogenase